MENKYNDDNKMMSLVNPNFRSTYSVGLIFRKILESEYDKEKKKEENLEIVISKLIEVYQKSNIDLAKNLSMALIYYQGLLRMISSNDLDKLYKDIIDTLKESIESSIPNITVRIESRFKSLISFVNKTVKYFVDSNVPDVKDALGIRIIISSDTYSEEELEELCHEIASFVMVAFEDYQFMVSPLSKHVGMDPAMKDYIYNPKSNGYKSIHIAFFNVLDRFFTEVQIRTKKMHRMAEENDQQSHKLHKKKYDDYKDIFSSSNQVFTEPIFLN